MATTQEPSADQEEYKFTPKLDARFALNLEQVLAVAIFGVLFVVLNFIPLRVTDIWGHVGYGQWIVDHGSLPTTDPWMPLSQGMQVVDSAWLSQVIFSLTERYVPDFRGRPLGHEALSHLFAIVSLLAYIVWTRVFFLQTRRLWLSMLGTGLLILVGWSRFATIRPENFAVLCFALLFLLLFRALAKHEDDSREDAGDTFSFDWLTWLGVPVVFALWANLHGSFPVGLAALGCFWLGRILESAWKTRSLVSVIRDREVRQWTYLGELALLATLLNPYGLDLWVYTVKFAGNPNLATVMEWQPLVILGVGGRQFALSVVLLLFVWRQSKRPVRPYEVLLLAVFGFAAIGGIRMLGWYAPVFVVVIAPHLAEIAGRLLPTRREDREIGEPLEEAEEGEIVLPPGYSFRYSLVALLLIWIAFALSPMSQLIFKKARTPEQLHGDDTPIELVAFLNQAYEEEQLPGGIVFHSQKWGDWLKHEGPESFQPFVTTNIHLIPPQVWRDYLRVMNLRSGWDRTLSRYDVDMIIVDKEDQGAFFGALNRSEDWSRRYEDDQSAIFTRVAQIPGQSRASTSDESDENEQEE